MMINPNMILNAVYPIGSLYLTTNNTNPGTFLGGTWEKITADAYLKIVDSNAGSLGGTSESHKIPVASMPAHKHGIGDSSGGTKIDACYNYSQIVGGGGVALVNPSSNYNKITGSWMNTAGGSQAYYPYYYGIYVFRRTA